jgi:hypothetical protein
MPMRCRCPRKAAMGSGRGTAGRAQPSPASPRRDQSRSFRVPIRWTVSGSQRCRRYASSDRATRRGPGRSSVHCAGTPASRNSGTSPRPPRRPGSVPLSGLQPHDHAPVVVLPQPLSPTSPIVCPALSEKSTPSTARTTTVVRQGRAEPCTKCFERPRTSRTASGVVWAPWRLRFVLSAGPSDLPPYSPKPSAGPAGRGVLRSAARQTTAVARAALHHLRTARGERAAAVDGCAGRAGSRDLDESLVAVAARVVGMDFSSPCV